MKSDLLFELYVLYNNFNNRICKAKQYDIEKELTPQLLLDKKSSFNCKY